MPAVYNPDSVIVIDCGDNRTRLVAWFLLLILVATATRGVGPVLNFLFGTLLGM